MEPMPAGMGIEGMDWMAAIGADMDYFIKSMDLWIISLIAVMAAILPL